MSVDAWLAFVITASVILVIPGPTIIYVVGQSLTHGRKAGIPLAFGVVSGDALCMTLSLLGLSAVLAVFSAAFLVIKYAGAAYLIYLGLKMIRSSMKIDHRPLDASAYHAAFIFRDVFLVNALNPKGIVFYSAFMPQFVNPGQHMFPQFVVLAVTFLCLALVNVAGYCLLAAKTNELFTNRGLSKAFNLTGGISLICAGVCSAAMEDR